MHGSQIIKVSHLEVVALIGILECEKTVAQRVRVDVELHMGEVNLAVDEVALTFLDYRQVRSIIIQTLTQGHTGLLETRVSQISQQLMALPGVQGLKLQISKPDIFPDCEPALCLHIGAC